MWLEVFMFSSVLFTNNSSQNSESDIGDENSWGDAALFVEDCCGPPFMMRIPAVCPGYVARIQYLHKQCTLQGTNISPKNGILKIIFLFPKVGYVNSLEGIYIYTYVVFFVLWWQWKKQFCYPRNSHGCVSRFEGGNIWVLNSKNRGKTPKMDGL